MEMNNEREMISMQSLTVTWHGHSCFSVEHQGQIVVFDPYDAAWINYPPLAVQAHQILISHQHGDHNFTAAVQLLPPAPGFTALPVRSVETSHDEAGGKKRGHNRINILEIGGLSIVHLGDLGHLLTPEQVSAIGQPDLLLIPVGGIFTIDAGQAWQVIAQLKPKNIAPMHYNSGLFETPLAPVDQFLALAPAGWTIKKLAGSAVQFDGTEQGLCLVFQYQPTL